MPESLERYPGMIGTKVRFECEITPGIFSTILDQEYGISMDRKTIYTEIETLRNFGLDVQKKRKNLGYYVVPEILNCRS